MAARASCLVLFLTITVTSAYNRRAVNDAFIERLNNGMKMAKEYFGMDSAAMKAADFVLRAFQHSVPFRAPPEQTDEHTAQQSSAHAEPFGSLRQLVKLVGLEPSQISAVAVNAIIFMAQMITTFLNGPQAPQRGRAALSGEPTAWVMERKSPKLQILLTLARNESLPNILEDFVKGAESEESSCAQLLVCRMTPFVSKMQKAVFGTEDREGRQDLRGSSVLYRHLPSRGELEQQGAECERRYPTCDLKH